MLVSKTKLDEWSDAKRKLDFYKELEMKLRKKIVGDITGNPTVRTTSKINIGEVEITAVYEVTPKIEDKKVLMRDYDSLSSAVKTCFPLKPDFSKTGYKKLDVADKRIADKYIVESPSAPTLEIKRKK